MSLYAFVILFIGDDQKIVGIDQKIENFFVQLELVNQLAKAKQSTNKMSTRAMSPFIAFCNSRRKELAAANPNANFGEIGMVLGMIWKSMTQSEKDAFMEKWNSQQTTVASGTSSSEPEVRSSVKEARAQPSRDQQPVVVSSEPEVRQSARLRNKRLGLNFWGGKINK